MAQKYDISGLYSPPGGATQPKQKTQTKVKDNTSSSYIDQPTYNQMRVRGFSHDDIVGLVDISRSSFSDSFKLGSQYNFDLNYFAQKPKWYLDIASSDDWGYNPYKPTDQRYAAKGEMSYKLRNSYILDGSDPDDEQRYVAGLPSKKFQTQQSILADTLNKVASGEIPKFDWQALGYAYDESNPEDVVRKQNGDLPLSVELEYSSDDYSDKIRKRYGLAPTKITSAGNIITSTTFGSANNAANITEKPTEKKPTWSQVLFGGVGSLFASEEGPSPTPTGTYKQVVPGVQSYIPSDAQMKQMQANTPDAASSAPRFEVPEETVLETALTGDVAKAFKTTYEAAKKQTTDMNKYPFGVVKSPQLKGVDLDALVVARDALYQKYGKYDPEYFDSVIEDTLGIKVSEGRLNAQYLDKYEERGRQVFDEIKAKYRGTMSEDQMNALPEAEQSRMQDEMNSELVTQLAGRFNLSADNAVRLAERYGVQPGKNLAVAETNDATKLFDAELEKRGIKPQEEKAETGQVSMSGPVYANMLTLDSEKELRGVLADLGITDTFIQDNVFRAKAFNFSNEEQHYHEYKRAQYADMVENGEAAEVPELFANDYDPSMDVELQKAIDADPDTKQTVLEAGVNAVLGAPFRAVTGVATSVANIFDPESEGDIAAWLTEQDETLRSRISDEHQWAQTVGALAEELSRMYMLGNAGRFLQGAVSGLAGKIGIPAVQKLVTASAGSAPFFVDSLGRNLKMSVQEGATIEEAWLYALPAALVEGFLEHASFDIMSGKGIKWLSRKLSPKAGFNALGNTVGLPRTLNYLSSVMTEGLQEVATDLAQNGLQALVYKPEMRFFGPGGIVDGDAMLNTFLISAAVGAIYSAPQLGPNSLAAKRLSAQMMLGQTEANIGELETVMRDHAVEMRIVDQMATDMDTFSTKGASEFDRIATNMPQQKLSSAQIKQVVTELQNDMDELGMLIPQLNAVAGPIALGQTKMGLQEARQIHQRINELKTNIGKNVERFHMSEHADYMERRNEWLAQESQVAAAQEAQIADASPEAAQATQESEQALGDQSIPEAQNTPQIEARGAEQAFDVSTITPDTLYSPEEINVVPGESLRLSDGGEAVVTAIGDDSISVIYKDGKTEDFTTDEFTSRYSRDPQNAANRLYQLGATPYDLAKLPQNQTVSPEAIKKLTQLYSEAGVELPNQIPQRTMQERVNTVMRDLELYPAAYAFSTMERIFENLTKDGADAKWFVDSYIEPTRKAATEMRTWTTNWAVRFNDLNVTSKGEAVAIGKHYTGEMSDADVTAAGYDLNRFQEIENTMREFFDEAWNMMRAARVANGFKDIGYIPDGYYPQNMRYDKETGMLGFLQSIIGSDAGNIVHTGTPTTSRIKERKGGGEIDYDITKTLGAYIHGVAPVIFLTDVSQRFEQLKNTLKKSGAHPQLTKYLTRYVEGLSGNGMFLDKAFPNLARASEKLTSQVSRSMIAYNFASVFVQTVPIVQAAAQTNPVAWARGFMEVRHNVSTRSTKMQEKFDFAARRYRTKNVNPAGRGKTALRVATEIGMKPFEMMDKLATGFVLYSKYYEMLGKGASEQEAVKAANDFAAKVMVDRSPGQTPLVYNTKMLKVLTQFQIEVGNLISNTFKDTRKDDQGNRKAFTGKFFSMLLASAFSDLLYQLVLGRKIMMDPLGLAATLATDIANGDDPTESVKKFGDGIMEQIPFAAILSSQGGRIPALQPLTSLFTSLGKADVGQKAINAASIYLLPVGGSQIRKTVNGILTLIKGENSYGGDVNDEKIRYVLDNNPDAWKVFQLLALGPSTISENVEYYDNDMSALNKVATEKYRTLEKAGIDEKTAYAAVVANGSNGTYAEKALAVLASIPNTTTEEKYYILRTIIPHTEYTVPSGMSPELALRRMLAYWGDTHSSHSDAGLIESVSADGWRNYYNNAISEYLSD